MASPSARPHGAAPAPAVPSPRGRDAAAGARRGAWIGAAACLGWVLHDLVVFAQAGDPPVVLRLLAPSAALVLAAALVGALVGARPRLGLVLAVLLTAAAFGTEALRTSKALEWLPRAALLLLAGGAAVALLARQSGLGAGSGALAAGAAACLAKTVYRSGWDEALWPVVVLLVALVGTAWLRTPLRVAGAAFGLAVAAGWIVVRVQPDLHPTRADLAPPGVVPPRGAPNLLLVVLDTVRADHLAPYGYERVTTPRLDARVEAEFERYAEARSTSSWTLPSHASLLTGLLPAQHGSASTGRFAQPLDDSITTLAERLRGRGWRTAAVPANQAWLRPVMGLDQGFEHFDDRHGSAVGEYFALVQTSGRFSDLGHVVYRDAEAITDLAIDWMEGVRGEPFFLFLNYMEAHEPYLPPDRFRGLFEDREPRDPWEPSLGEQELLYDRELAFLDEELGRLFAWLEAEGLWEETAVVVTADHGEGLGDHGLHFHGRHLFEELIRVPLYVKPAGGRARAVNETPVSGTDVFHLMLALTGAPGRRADPTAVEEPVLGEYYASQDNVFLQRVEERSGLELSHDVLTWLEGPVKFLVTSGGEVLAHDLSRDPGEEFPLELTPAQRESALARARSWWDQNPVRPEEEPAWLSEEARERLEALGYATDDAE